MGDHSTMSQRAKHWALQDHTGKILYVANENDNTVTIIDLERRVPLDEVQVGAEPEGMGLRTVRSSSLHRRRPIWRISSTPRGAGSSPTCWSMHGPGSRSSSATPPRSGFRPKSVER